MDAQRASLMQMQIKNNASDLQDYLKNLQSWETDIKEKDVALSGHKSILKEVGGAVSKYSKEVPYCYYCRRRGQNKV